MKTAANDRSATAHQNEDPVLEAETRRIGLEIFALVDTVEPPSLFSKKGFHGALMDWAMRDERLKAQLFRFVDVLPSLSSPAEITRHLQEYFAESEIPLPTPLRAALAASGFTHSLVSGSIKSQVESMARQFMLGDDPSRVIAALRQLHDRGITYTVDILGETVVSEIEADRYANRYLELMELLSRETLSWPATNGTSSNINVSVKISALYSQIHAADPETALERLSARLRPLLRRARDLHVFINFDMEQYALKNLTLHLFTQILSESEFAEGPACGLALQAYLKDSKNDLKELIGWAREHNHRITIRLVKGAYWDYESIISEQRNWPSPVFETKAETDAGFEQLSDLLFENADIVSAAFGTHNVRSIAHVLARALRLGIPSSQFEFQMLHGMAEPLKTAILKKNLRLREYCPVGELLPGMAYLVRRLLENSSNEGFLANAFAKSTNRNQLLQSPVEVMSHTMSQQLNPPEESHFINEPLTDFTCEQSRRQIRLALHNLRSQLGRRHPLVVANREVPTADWKPSLNPANQREVIGYAAKASVADADAAVTVAHLAQPEWAKTAVTERASLLTRVSALMRRDKAVLTALEILEAGKSWTEADADVAEAIDYCDFYAATMRDLAKEKTTQRVAAETNRQHWQPRGVVAVIAPWNFPLAILTGMTTAALVTGNTVVMKSSDNTPVIASRLMALFMEAGVPAGVVNLLFGAGSEVGSFMVSHPKVDMIAFTGSMEVGLKIWESAGRTQAGQINLKKVICEMGGKNALIIDSDADLDEAVTGTLQSAFGYSGQKCSALSRLIVVGDSYDRFLERLIAAADSLSIGPAEEPGSFVVPVISRNAQQRIMSSLEQAKKEARLVWQGQVPQLPEACYVTPAIFTDVYSSSHLFCDEIFGPILAVSRASNFAEAIALANESRFALTGGCYSRSPKNIERAKRELVCGNLYINRPITGALVCRQPFGGFKMSGAGTKAGGVEYLEQFMWPRVVTENCLRRGFAPTE